MGDRLVALVRGRSGAGTLGPIIAVAAVAVIALASLVAGARSGPLTLAERTDAVARTIRCPACGNLSLADATSSLALEMRSSIRSQLELGRTAEQIRDSFMRRYGSWIVLSPDPDGLGLVAWLAPVAGLLVGMGVLAGLIRRSRRATWAGRGAETG